jgi:4-oxalocrotonate tautomerase
MPLVRISLLRGKADGRKAGEAVFRAMVDTLNVPPRDNFQIITEHEPGTLIYDPEYLDIARGDGFIAIQITLNEGRSVEMKKALFKRVAEALQRELGVRPQDVFVSLVEVKKENWSFGNGAAQYAS